MTNQKAEKIETLSHMAELLYRRAAMLNLYICRIQRDELHPARLIQELDAIQALTEKMQRQIPSELETDCAATCSNP